ncbi:MAG TPA: TRAM domain-containing protein [Vicinamibacterales bacterium]|nr:TRAM domain-containing protein [Vicinamibacterales bacterium]
MSLAEGQEVALVIEKPAAGGRMIARHLGQVVLVRGAIPGERVRAWIERAERQMAFAVTREVVEPSPDRRPSGPDPLCGGALYSHIRYDRQLAIKSDVIRDAFARLGRHPIENAVSVAGSPEEGYRMRARFHVRAGRAGFYREGTHELCDAGGTHQLGDAAVSAVTALAEALERDTAGAVTSIAVTENIAATERAVHLDLAPGARPTTASLERHAAAAGLRGISARTAAGEALVAGDPIVRDPLSALVADDASGAVLQRHAESFFQGNRFLLRDLVTAVVGAVPDDGEVLDLYAGVGLFSAALAAAGRSEITAVEGDRAGGADLRENARPHAPRLKARIQRVEDYLSARAAHREVTIVIDPPRTGLSKEAADRLLRQRPARIVYVSCDPATLARDARKMLDAGYRLEGVRAFDLFPNTPHVETLAVFIRA